MLEKKQKGGHVNNGGADVDTAVFQEEKRAHYGFGKSYYHHFKQDFLNISTAFESIEEGTNKLLTQLLKVHGSIIIDMCAVVYMERDDPIGDGIFQIINDSMYFRSKPHKLLTLDDIDKSVTKCVDEINNLKNK